MKLSENSLIIVNPAPWI